MRIPCRASILNRTSPAFIFNKIKMERSALHCSQHSTLQASPSGGRVFLAPKGLSRLVQGRRVAKKQYALPELAHIDIDNFVSSLSHMLTLGYEPIVLPCSSMNCGDMVYRRYATICKYLNMNICLKGLFAFCGTDTILPLTQHLFLICSPLFLFSLPIAVL